jgi:hypothetical protein
VALAQVIVPASTWLTQPVPRGAAMVSKLFCIKTCAFPIKEKNNKNRKTKSLEKVLAFAFKV